MNIGILLAAGNSTRFNSKIPKQIYPIKGKPVISYSIDILQTLDDLIIVTNSACKDQIIAPTVLINDQEDRLQSIRMALDHIQDASKIIVHDAARPFITTEHLKVLLAQTVPYAQYCIKPNSLLKKVETGFEAVNREDFIELCTPFIADYKLYKEIFPFLETKAASEVVVMLSMLGIPFNIIEGSAQHLRKITTIEDI